MPGRLPHQAVRSGSRHAHIHVTPDPLRLTREIDDAIAARPPHRLPETRLETLHEHLEVPTHQRPVAAQLNDALAFLELRQALPSFLLRKSQ